MKTLFQEQSHFFSTFFFEVCIFLRKYLILPIVVILIVTGCGSSEDNTLPMPDFGNLGDPIPVGKRDRTPCNENATPETKALLAYLASLSEDPYTGTIVGQSCSKPYDINSLSSLSGYGQLVRKLQQSSGKWVGIIALDYEHDRACEPAVLSAANKTLIDYWNSGGLVSVGVSPLNPWLIDETDITGSPGNWLLSRTQALTEEQLAQIDLNKLIDPDEDVYRAWRRKLDRIADALLELQDASVVVLFKPIQEPNASIFWWGVLSHMDDPTPYINLYRDMYDYFTNEKGLNNLVWLYSPINQVEWQNGEYIVAPQMELYPGDAYVDIIASTSYKNSCEIYGYESLVATGKPLAVAEWGPDHVDNKGLFDNRTYINRVEKQCTAISFWMSWDDWYNVDGSITSMSLIRNRKAKKLMNDPRVITREKLKWKEFM